MPKHEPMTAKAIGIRIKQKGLQQIKYYCQMCNKQCRDDNGFKCHIKSESHQRQALIVSENPELFVSQFSKQFMDDFMFILKTHYKTKRVLANTVFQEYIKDKEHTHLNGTRWTSLTEFARWLGEQGIVEVDDSERGVMITYIDRDPETLRRQELEAKRAQQAEEEAKKRQAQIESQREATRRVYEQLAKEAPAPEPIRMVRIEAVKDKPDDEKPTTSNAAQNDMVGEPSSTTTSCDRLQDKDQDKDQSAVVERPVFGLQTMTLKTATTSAFKPLKKRLVHKGSHEARKRHKPS